MFLVNAQHVKNVPGRKSDVSDCQWIQYLHAVGLLKASFRPPDQICVIRSLWRHRESFVQMAAEHTMHMQKALSQMNLQLHHVFSDITGLSGMSDTRCDSGRRTETYKAGKFVQLGAHHCYGGWARPFAVPKCVRVRFMAWTLP